MASYSGALGLLCFGGVLDGTPLVAGSLASNVTTMDIDANGGDLDGVVMVGDTFTLAGESGSPTHTVTGSNRPASTNYVSNITFTPAIATGGVADNAAVTFTSNSIANMETWALNIVMDNYEEVFFGTKWSSTSGGIGRWNGSGTGKLDYGDAVQAEIIDKLVAASPTIVEAALAFQVAPGKVFYGDALVTMTGFSHQAAALCGVEFNFVGHNRVDITWQD